LEWNLLLVPNRVSSIVIGSVDGVLLLILILGWYIL